MKKKNVLIISIMLILSIALISTIIGAYSPNSLKMLIETNQCPGCDLTGINLRGYDLTGANLEGADLSGANLRNAILVNANLRDVSLRPLNGFPADLTRADLSGADLTGAILFLCRLEGVTYNSGTVGLDYWLAGQQ